MSSSLDEDKHLCNKDFNLCVEPLNISGILIIRMDIYLIITYYCKFA